MTPPSPPLRTEPALTPRDGAAALLVIVIWALNFIFGKVGLSELPPLLMLALRFVLVTVLLLPFLGRIRRRQWRLVVAVSVVLGVCHFGLMFFGLAHVGAGPAAIAIQLTVPFSAILGWVCFGERIGRVQLAGMAMAFCGVYLLAGEPAGTATEAASRASNSWYLLAVTGAAFAWAVANVLIKRLGPINVFTLNGWVALIAAPHLLAASLLLEHGQAAAIAAAGWRAWSAVVFMAVASSIVAYGLWYFLIERYPMNRVVPMTLLSPVLAVVFAVLLLGETLSATMVVGGILTLGGVAVIELIRPAPPPMA
ncbi:MAG: EamA family transporter [Rhodospirillales bacterium]